jgi:hypothetical protein
MGNNTQITTARYIQWLNWAMLDICGIHRKRAFPPKRFHFLEADAVFSTTLVTGLVTSSTSTVVTTGLTTAGLVGSVIKLTAYDETLAGAATPDGLLDQARIITAQDVILGTQTLSSAWTVIPDAYTTYEIYTRFLDLTTVIGVNPTDTLWAIQKLEKLEDGTLLEHKPWESLVGKSFSSIGTPTQFARRDSKLVLDPTPDAVYSYRMWYYRYPTQLVDTDLTAECEMPDDWQEIMVLGAIWRGFRALMEPQRAQNAYDIYTQEATNKQDSYMIEEKYITKAIGMRRS